MTAKTTGQVQLKALAVYCTVESPLSALIRHVRLQRCDVSFTGAVVGRKTLYTLARSNRLSELQRVHAEL